NALADVIAGRYNQFNTELVDINKLRTEKLKLDFCKMQSCGNDYIIFNNMNGEITCPESLAINFSDRHYAIGADGIVMIEKSDVADAKVRVFNSDGSDGGLAANPIRCVAKYLFDSRIVNSEQISIESCGVVRNLRVNSFNGVASSVAVNFGKPSFVGNKIPCSLEGEIIDREIVLDGKTYRVTCVNVGNPHCVVFVDRVENIDMEALGQALSYSGMFPNGIFLECVRVVNSVTIKMRVWEKVNGETWACGSAAAAAATAAIINGKCVKGETITVKLKGGDLFVKLDENGEVELDGFVKQSFKGIIEI
ncbi:MAG: diaminopimelate epimerase, partial [Clostridia bacterium]|nr:diaminopimelate epimerase [Clostridia bacterium]